MIYSESGGLLGFFQGILGADGRHYILDLYRTTPTDVNFLEGYFSFNILASFTCLITFVFSFSLKCLYGDLGYFNSCNRS